MFRENLSPTRRDCQLKSNIATWRYTTKKEVEFHLWMNFGDIFVDLPFTYSILFRFYKWLTCRLTCRSLWVQPYIFFGVTCIYIYMYVYLFEENRRFPKHIVRCDSRHFAFLLVPRISRMISRCCCATWTYMKPINSCHKPRQIHRFTCPR